MVNAKDSFNAAYNREIDTLGYGAQAKIAKAVGTSERNISAIKNGSRGGSRDLQELIAKELGFKYEEFLAIGRMILEGKPEQEIEKTASALRKRPGAHSVNKEIHSEWNNEQVVQEETPEHLTATEKQVLDAFRQLDSDGKNAVLVAALGGLSKMRK